MEKIFYELSRLAFLYFPRLIAALFIMLIAWVLGKALQQAFLKIGCKFEEEKPELKMIKKEEHPMNRRVFYCATALLIGAILAAGSMAYGSEYDKGKALYGEKCAICHGANGMGDGPAASALSPPPKDLNTPAFWQQKNIDQAITRTLRDGKGPMPSFDLNEEETGAIIDFMSHTFKK